MTISTQIDLVSFSTATTGTGSIAPGSAVAGYRDASALTSGATYSYAIKDGNNYEDGQGVWNGTVLTRVVNISSNSNTAITLSGTATVVITALANDFRDFGRWRLLGRLVGADFNSTADQAILLTQPGSGPWSIAFIQVANPSISLSVAKGAFYAGVGKTSLMFNSGAAQGFAGLTTPSSSALIGATPSFTPNAAAASYAFLYQPATTISLDIYLSLSTAQGAAATANVYVWGFDLT